MFSGLETRPPANKLEELILEFSVTCKLLVSPVGVPVQVAVVHFIVLCAWLGRTGRHRRTKRRCGLSCGVGGMKYVAIEVCWLSCHQTPDQNQQAFVDAGQN